MNFEKRKPYPNPSVFNFLIIQSSADSYFEPCNMDRLKPATSFEGVRRHIPFRRTSSPGDLRNPCKNQRRMYLLSLHISSKSSMIIRKPIQIPTELLIFFWGGEQCLRGGEIKYPWFSLREGMTCVGGSSTGFVTHIYIQGFDQVQGDRSRCDQNSDTAFDRRPITRSVFMVEILIIPESHLRLCSATIGTDHGQRGPAQSFPSINLVPPSLRENLRDVMMRYARGAIRVVFERILSESDSLVAAALDWIVNYFIDWQRDSPGRED